MQLNQNLYMLSTKGHFCQIIPTSVLFQKFIIFVGYTRMAYIEEVWKNKYEESSSTTTDPGLGTTSNFIQLTRCLWSSPSKIPLRCFIPTQDSVVHFHTVCGINVFILLFKCTNSKGLFERHKFYGNYNFWHFFTVWKVCFAQLTSVIGKQESFKDFSYSGRWLLFLLSKSELYIITQKTRCIGYVWNFITCIMFMTMWSWWKCNGHWIFYPQSLSFNFGSVFHMCT